MLRSAISRLLESGKKRVELVLPYSEAGILELLHREGAVISSEYTEDGINVSAVIRPERWGKVRQYIKNSEAGLPE